MAGLTSELLLKRWNKRFAMLNAKRRIRKRQMFRYCNVKVDTVNGIFYVHKSKR